MGTPLPWDQAVDLGWNRGRASAQAAASIFRIDAQLGRPADVNEAWRSPEQANANRARWERFKAGGPWAPYALGAEDSVHCWGGAADSDDWYDPYAAAVWRDNGWRQTARYNDDRDEPWHGEHFPHLDKYAGQSASTGGADMPLNNDDLQKISDKVAATVRDWVLFDVPGRERTTLDMFVRDTYETLTRLEKVSGETPARVWAQPLEHTIARGEGGEPLMIPAGDFLRFEPAEHANTRAAVARVVTGDIELDELANEIAAKFPQLDVHALAVAAADELDRRTRERYAATP